MTFSEHAFDACCREAKAIGRRLNKTEWLEAMQEAYDSYPHEGLLATDTPKVRATRVKAVDAEWLESLEQNPAYAGIDIKRELGKAQAWASVRKVGVSQMRFLNWLNKAQVSERPIQYNGAGATSFKPATAQAPSEPAGWREWVRENSTDPSHADKPWSAMEPVAQKYILSQLK
jgi:hypothetical protein